jgi:CheY-like chemotaxis protein
VTKVIYVEDNDDNIFMLKMRLELLGDFEVLTAEDGEKGCAMAISERPDIILMDLEMPVVDGCEATRRLKAIRKPATSQSSRCPRTRLPASAKRRSQQDATSPYALQDSNLCISESDPCCRSWPGTFFDNESGTTTFNQPVRLYLRSSARL